MPSSCPSCGSKVEIGRIWTFIHLFYIPLLPVAVRKGAECMRCGSKFTISKQPVPTAPSGPAVQKPKKEPFNYANNFWTLKFLEFIVMSLLIFGAIFILNNNIGAATAIFTDSYSIRGETAYDNFVINTNYYDPINDNVYIEVASSHEVSLDIVYDNSNFSAIFTNSKIVKFKENYTSITVTALTTEYTEVDVLIFEKDLTGTQMFLIYSPLFIVLIWGAYSTVQTVKRKRTSV